MIDYIKYFYWIPPDNIDSTLDDIRKNAGITKISEAKLRQCEALQKSKKITHVPPSVWSENCYRQGSWFRTSDLQDYHLIVSNEELGIKASFSGKITRISIDNYPEISKEAYLNLLQTKEFKNRAPEEWFHLLEREIPLFQNYLSNNNVKLELDDFLDMHSSNHANFLFPKGENPLIVTHEGEKIACSLFSQVFTCSACLELFGVLGRHLEIMILKKCPGLKYVLLGEDEYFLIKIRR